jgi:hypothetical protein
MIPEMKKTEPAPGSQRPTGNGFRPDPPTSISAASGLGGIFGAIRRGEVLVKRPEGWTGPRIGEGDTITVTGLDAARGSGQPPQRPRRREGGRGIREIVLFEDDRLSRPEQASGGKVVHGRVPWMRESAPISLPAFPLPRLLSRPPASAGQKHDGRSSSSRNPWTGRGDSPRLSAGGGNEKTLSRPPRRIRSGPRRPGGTRCVGRRDSREDGRGLRRRINRLSPAFVPSSAGGAEPLCEIRIATGAPDPP